jgi:hypothetical protein
VNLFRVRGLDEVPVEAGFVAAAHVPLPAVSAQGDEQGAGCPRHRAQPAGDLATVHAGQADVQQGDGGRGGGRQRQRRGAVVGRGGFVAPALQQPGERVRGVAVVIDNQDARAGGGQSFHRSDTFGGGQIATGLTRE